MNLTDPTFYQVSTVQLDMTANFTMNVSDDVTIYVDVQSLNMGCDGSYNNTVKVSLVLFKQEIKVAAKVVQGVINAKLSAGLSVNNWISTHTPLKFFNLTQMEVIIEEEYAMVGLTPQFDHRAV